MSHQVALAFEDGVTRFITCDADQTVADASYRQRINIPLDCRDGACGTCKAFCDSGEYDGGTYIDDALSDDEAEAGYVLPCSMKPRSDLVLQIASTSEVAKTRAATYTGTVAGLDRLSPTTVALTVETPQRSELAFLPGQYVNIAVPGAEATRSYSFSNAPEEKSLTFLVKLTPGGQMSEYLEQRAAVGDEVSFTGPNGSFFLRESDRPLLLLAGGTGLAPILSILRTLRDSGSTRPVHLVYGVSTDEDLVGLDDIEELAGQLPQLTWDHCVSDPDSTAVNKGYVMGLIRPEHLHDGDVAVYLCGPPPMVEAVRTHFADEGVTPTGFYYEKFALSSAPAQAEPAPTGGAPATEPVPETVAEAPPVTPGQPSGAPATEPAAETVAQAPPVDETVRSIARQEVHPLREVTPLGGGTPPDPATLVLTDAEDLQPVPEGRRIAGQETFPGRDTAPLVAAPPLVAPVAVAPDGSASTQDGYEIGEEHPSVEASDAIFEARQALELGALDLVLGRVSTQQVTGYRLLAESTLPHVEGDRFTDAAAYTETNAAFHDYLFTLTGNEHLLRAYQALGVKGRMEEVLRGATWCHPRCATDHVEIVDAVERGDRAEARRLVTEHAERSKLTMRRAMDDRDRARRPRFVSPGRYEGQVVMITGAAQGIGEATARRIAAEGGQLVLVDRSELVLGLADELAASSAGAIAATADLEAPEGAREAVELALARYGRIDVLVNNVGGAISFKPFTEFTDDEIRAEVDRSLMTTLYSCRAVLPSMVERGQGVILNVSSAATRGINRIPYSAAKGGINAITSSLALEYAGAGIRVVATAPGGTEAPPRRISRGTPTPQTEQERQWFQAHIDQTLDHSPMNRYGTLDEQAAAITFLASPEASYITGTVLPVAGGDLG